ncbi:MAG: hypothetical protein A2268_01175 [Candidatus Raymondbacteria bacterium RifOxyA12_full_50_37]|uniref:Ion-translocating oxidoreductase complex subunit B n=1 Tax=Candidatus Raymondbacteria bacterium RIFOXYD12_FULL_49_13 TaxID=1817890 RepID=A0A1F7FFZ2_UNCRA|nr:MAG: hypothetical protein A2268_01175 [Candidatus Raymondbacteria bacterium RifOxyA12_full_50_37]OGJ86414.1 MAG: hypothetical protein A2248_14140 [Candidatus Raymondbacteria bacterium RIFOXYA2_FULL_49_16]OGJ95584.1 MAG: hypothetical protein A2453_12915 [Candidatus Raymondbacteria bacterium RIFOXYC2_FULL_50_21]OGK05543.1 MAG: hypothetical protein A2519_05505 [Candidatus Raymondbacteria bacterium RIFOXYD12_FULL_49_13]OGP39995.1 MAG: hypothetical protein A2324_11185 [Candidatus Raymondbacteria 
MQPVLIATLSLLGLGLLLGGMLVIAARIFFVREDPRIEAVTGALLGANCGACGFAGCAAAATAVVAGKAGPSVCVAGGNAIAIQVARVLGIEVRMREPEIALPGCRYDLEHADLKYFYNGFRDCRAATALYGGSKTCTIGCLGLGTCAQACPFNAITMHGTLPVVNAKLCTGCGICEKICPKGIIVRTTNEKRFTSEYTAAECTAPCQRACPAGIDIPRYIKAIAEKRYEDSIRVMREKNPLLLVCGRICPAPCEFECRRNLADQAVSINTLKKFVADYEMASGRRVVSHTAEKTGKKVAVIGGGAEGLTAAYYLARLGHSPVIFEAMPELGGVLRYVITRDRLPKAALDWEIDGILQSGVEVKTNCLFGRDITFDSLFNDGFAAILFTTGGMDSRKVIRGPAVSESSMPGVYLKVDLLQEGAEQRLISGKRVVNARPGARELVVGLSGTGNVLTTVNISTDTQAPKAVSADCVIVETGRLSEMVIVPVFEEGVRVGWRTVETFRGFSEQRNEGLFGAVEAGRVSDYTAVVNAVGAGRKIVRSLHRYLSGDPIEPQKKLVHETKDIQNIDRIEDLETILRTIPSLLGAGSPAEALQIMHTDAGFDEQSAVHEASRCLDCGLVCYTRVKQKA